MIGKDDMNGRYAINRASIPRRVLIIRLQAIGDTVLTYPIVQALKNEYPGMEIDFLTRHTQQKLSKNIAAIHQVFAITNSQRVWRQLLNIAGMLPTFFVKKYEVIIDLQQNKASRFLRQILRPAGWAEFDKHGITPATSRYRNAVESTGLLLPNAYPNIHLKNANAGNHLLKENGWDGVSNLVVLNPAGLFKSRNWPLDYYAAFARKWLSINAQTQFLIMGDARINAKARFLKAELGNTLIDLQQKTTLEEAFCILSKVQFMISEDSGLYWMAWVQQVPSIAMYGSTPGSRMNMGGSHTRILTSSDLPCGDCFMPHCKFGETAPCLSRYTPDMLIALARELLDAKRNNSLHL